jgi:hypothetical protein
MFGRPILLKSPHTPPEYVSSMLDALRRLYDEDCEYVWFPSGINQAYGCCRFRGARLELHTPEKDCPLGRLVVCHEYAHVLVPNKGKPLRGTKPSYHSEEFWDTVAQLYERYGLLEFACSNQGDRYATGRKYMKEKYLGVNFGRQRRTD